MGKPDDDQRENQEYRQGPGGAEKRYDRNSGSKPNAPAQSAKRNGAREKLDEALDVYRTCYRERYGRDCLPIDRAAETMLKDMLASYGEANVRELIRFYFSQDGGESGWFKEKGHDIPTLKANANRIWSWAADEKKPQWIVGKTASGEDIVSPDPDCLRGCSGYMKPVPIKN